MEFVLGAVVSIICIIIGTAIGVGIAKSSNEDKDKKDRNKSFDPGQGIM